ncbi:histidine decarboxylase [Chryseobacterium sp. P1-3]|uniref:histidine decarboxylase n=1 Tax=Chryseobacterium sp. (strain P1-3) TaxID=1517683 RepID=UPI0004E6AC5E|nr:histidine decarboxylase [Chryseobacterium sp. P1-3]KFF73912.1 histidine decarboxylase [Chryseobacterium sp. P1-3]
MKAREQKKLINFINVIKEKSTFSIGYPFARDFDYTELYDLFQYPIANVGDPFIESNYAVNSFEIEREVIQFFAGLFRAPKDNYSGYVTSGGSEGNLYGLYIAREIYPEAIVYHSSEAHYSITKNIRLLNLRSVEIQADSKGEMDYNALEQSIEQHRHLPVIIIANIGTTMTEAKDDIPTIRQILKKCSIESYYIHCDAALSGAYLPLLEDDPRFDFKNGIDSIACSGHKFIGSPVPCGIAIVKKNYKERLGQYISYIGSQDTTIAGSRNGHSPVFLWYAVKKLGREGMLLRAQQSLSMAIYVQRRLEENNIFCFRNENAITVVFSKPDDQLCRKWQLATKNGYAHLICMPGISKNIIDDFFNDLLKTLPVSNKNLLGNACPLT